MTTSGQGKLALPARAVNAVGEIANRRLGYRYDIAADRLFRVASRQTGLSDYGDPFVTDGLKLLLDSLESQGNLSFFGRLAMRADVLLAARNRLRMVDALKRAPEINDVPLRKPIVILGFPRTGTSLLHRLFWQDPQFRAPLAWELWSPLPNSEPPSVEQRIQIAKQRIAGLVTAVPQFSLIHDIVADEPEECVLAFPYHLLGISRPVTEEYKAWSLNNDYHAEYAYYKQMLQGLQWQQPERAWVLKTPYHIWKMGSLLTTFPDALIIQTHRDPKKVLSSWCSLVFAVQLVFSRKVNAGELGREWLDLFKMGMNNALTERDKLPAERVFDIQYNDFVTQPLAVVARIYDHFGLTLSTETKQRMEAWLANHQQHKRGKHTYTLAEFGLDATTVERELGDYIQRFNIPLESSS